jgi:hypothetical protein
MKWIHRLRGALSTFDMAQTTKDEIRQAVVEDWLEVLSHPFKYLPCPGRFARLDGVVAAQGELVGAYEVKCLNMTYESFAAKRTFLLNLEKFQAAIGASKILGVSVFGVFALFSDRDSLDPTHIFVRTIAAPNGLVVGKYELSNIVGRNGSESVVFVKIESGKNCEEYKL